MIRLILALLFSSILLAQLPAPPVQPNTHVVTYIGVESPQVMSGLPDAQPLAAYCDTIFYRQAATSLGIAVGGSIFWESSTVHGAVPFFIAGPYDASIILPAAEAAPGFDLLYADLSQSIIVSPSYVYNGTMWVVSLDVPNSSALVGTMWLCQSFRVDPNLWIYLSNAVVVEVCL